eukprot:SAG31_NODE_4664_length_3056_cov_3.064592_3_plen_114_part_00
MHHLFVFMCLVDACTAHQKPQHATTGALDGLAARAWTDSLQAEFERLRIALPTLEYGEADRLLKDAIRKLGPRPATLAFPQDKIEHLVVLFVENRAFDHIFGEIPRKCLSQLP